ncbi:MAG: GH5_40 [uncultured Thermomicrobiales bacterium]|uniref:GH5_40 n=1 Tax=uncultured Thermomicrobiales bacterium TaxID=1645740 RepID=A0A6J4VGF7_9BACT|nr:MAG: GH5_40 [uncultured Thermomicrobiales bacterium]
MRGTGARNVILLGGVQYANGFSRFRTYAPRDPLNNLAASWHSYNFMHWDNETTWDAQIGIPTAGVPLIAGEIGQDDCKTAFLERTLRWLDAREASYLGWAWNTWARCDGPVLIDDYDGTPSAMGRGLYDHLVQLGPAPLAPRPGETSGGAGEIDPSAPVAAPDPTSALILYDDVVPAPFWVRPVGVNATDPCDGQTRVGGRCSYALSLSSWGALSIGSDGGFATGGYDRLEWSFNTHWQSLANFSIALTAQNSGEAIRAIPLDQATILADLGDGWVRLAVPMADLNPDGGAIGALILRNASGRDLGTIHLDDVRFVPDTDSLGVALTAGAQATAIDRPAAAR